MTTRFGKRYKNANGLFTSSLLRGGRISPETLLDTYKYSESRKLAEMKEMYQNITAARELGVPEYVIRKRIKRKGINKEIFNELTRGVYTPKRPNKFFIDRIGEITRDLNSKEATDIPNPYFEALPTINDIIANNRNTNVLTNQLNFNLVESFSEGGRVGMQQGGPITEEDVVIQIWLAEPEAVKRIHKYDYNNYYQSGEWVSKIRNEEIPTQSNTNPVVRSNIEPSNVQLAASGMNQALTKPFNQLSSIEKEQILFNRA